MISISVWKPKVFDWLIRKEKNMSVAEEEGS